MKKQIATNLLNELLDSLLITSEQKECLKLVCDLFYNAGSSDTLTQQKDILK